MAEGACCTTARVCRSWLVENRKKIGYGACPGTSSARSRRRGRAPPTRESVNRIIVGVLHSPSPVPTAARMLSGMLSAVDAGRADLGDRGLDDDEVLVADLAAVGGLAGQAADAARWPRWCAGRWCDRSRCMVEHHGGRLGDAGLGLAVEDAAAGLVHQEPAGGDEDHDSCREGAAPRPGTAASAAQRAGTRAKRAQPASSGRLRMSPAR